MKDVGYHPRKGGEAMARIQESGEMYLETILILSQKGPVRAIDVGDVYKRQDTSAQYRQNS